LVTVSIQDSGAGMTENELNTLFLIDRCVDQKGSDKEVVHGLGLILCKEFTELNGGKITVKSEKGKGSTFSFTVRKDLTDQNPVSDTL